MRSKRLITDEFFFPRTKQTLRVVHISADNAFDEEKIEKH